MTYEEISKRASALPEPLVVGGARLVVHIQTSDAAIEDLLNLIRGLANEKKLDGFVNSKPSGGDNVINAYVRTSL